ncbi:50S ribosomal protein L10 [Dermatobacter hominis]|uniref:50S ribosomal protein L10 n=1 Tax=Dermatobacter hominis TaxID=2884263 RepID=UPI001D105666|nr:50S ribosomal protein L10 [Dermatobacter hominis]UDY33895.1 50S ribosomal protein L10 [Dermatobacter hominis]
MENPRPDKVAVVDEVKDKFQDADAVIITEYRGLTVRDLQDLRTSLREAGGEYRVYKNTLVRRATTALDLALDEQLLGPTALTFVGDKADGTPGDVVTVAKALKTFAKANPLLVLKGGVLGDSLLDEAALSRLAEVAPREELLARLAGGMAAPMQNFASLLNAIPQKMAYALQALIEQGGASTAAPATESAAADDDADTTAEADPADTAEAEAADAAPAEDTDQDETPDDGDAVEASADDTAQEEE